MRIDLSHNLREVASGFDLMFNDQVPFALAKALTVTARAISAQMPGALEEEFDRPTEFTKRGWYVTPARKDSLESVVGPKEAQAAYLGYQIEGGQRQPRRVALRLPSEVQLDAHGNVPKGLIKQLVARAQAGRRATKSQAKRFGVSQEDALFYGQPSGDRPAGIYQRAKGRLVPLVVFPRQPAEYEARFDFTGKATQVADAEFGPAFEAALAAAMATAR
jgi:hypothetical protein